ncbi:MAG: N-acetyltransferase [Clostridia bacterium]|nr:N-acetyltransferase [Clostridia bacterium]
MSKIVIRREKAEEYREVENLVRESFFNVYRPGCLEHFVLKCLRDEPDFVPELDFVMEKDGEIIGQNVFVRTVIHADDGREIPIMTMGPICIAPAYKRQGYGKMLLDYSLEKAKEAGCKALCFEGNILFYGKSGFDYASKFGIRYHGLPEGADASFFLLKELEPGYFRGITGEYATPKGYFVWQEKPEEFERYDATFPYKEKLKLPGQLE